MDVHGLYEFVVPISILQANIVDFEGLPQKRWVTRGIILKNEAGDDIAKVVCGCRSCH